jgi:hypothetical protein
LGRVKEALDARVLREEGGSDPQTPGSSEELMANGRVVSHLPQGSIGSPPCVSVTDTSTSLVGYAR